MTNVIIAQYVVDGMKVRDDSKEMELLHEASVFPNVQTLDRDDDFTLWKAALNKQLVLFWKLFRE